MYKFLLIPLLLVTLSSSFCHAQVITVSKKRPPQMDVRGYQKIVIGDVVGATGAKTTRAMDLSDALTSQLFNNSDGHEIIDRSALEQILSSQGNITVINENTVSTISKKVSSALLITARIQNEKVYSEHKSRVHNASGCAYLYWDELTGDITAQVKIIDVKTGKMIFTNPIIQNIKIKTVEDCDPRKADTEPFLKETTAKLATAITKLIVPWDEEVSVTFNKPLITLFKNPLKNLPVAIQSFQSGNNQVGLQILKDYSEDNSLKPDVRNMAIYNYGVGLFIDGQYKLAAEYIGRTKSFNAPLAYDMLQKIQTEQNFEYKLSTVNKQ